MKLHESALTQINFVLENLTAINGAMRLVPGSHRLKQNPPNLLQDWNRMGSMGSLVSQQPGVPL
jgi:ectoine hydroxylase-related dioxygenase (phytanoyl-CoA dioxygenase family)